MSSVSEALINTIRELQELPSLQHFSLGGGTNLALRYNHRQSIDIDLFCPDIIGTKGYAHIVKKIKELYDDKIFGCDYPCEQDDQFYKSRTFFLQLLLANIQLLLLGIISIRSWLCEGLPASGLAVVSNFNNKSGESTGLFSPSRSKIVK